MQISIPAGVACTLTATELESGTHDAQPALGDGSGKWRLVVESDQSLVVMSLLESPTGHLTNLLTSR